MRPLRCRLVVSAVLAVALCLSVAASVEARGDPLPIGAVARFGDARLNHRGVLFLAFSPDGNTLASAGNDGRVLLWDVKSGNELRELLAPSFSNYSSVWSPLAFSSDGRTIALCCPDKSLRLWDVSTGKETHKFACGFVPLTVAFRPDGNVIAVGGEGGSIRQWALPSGADLGTWGEFKSVFALAYSGDGSTLAAIAHVGPGNQKPLFSIWDVATTREVSRQDAGGAGSYAGRLAPDGRTYYLPTPDGKAVRMFDLKTAKELRRTDGEANIPACQAVSGDGRLLTATSGDGVLRVWETASGKLLHRLRIETGYSGRLALSQDGSLLAVTPFGSQNIHLWDVAAGRERFQFRGHPGGILSAAFSQDARTLYTVSRDESRRSPPTTGEPWSLRHWNAATGDERKSIRTNFEAEVHWSVFSPDATRAAVVTQEGTLRLLDVATGKELRRWQMPTRTITTRFFTGGAQASETKYQAVSISCLIFSHDGATLYATTPDPEAKIYRWEVATGKALPPLDHPPLKSILLTCNPSPDGKTLLLADFQSGETRLILVAADTGREVHSIDAGRQMSGASAFSGDGRTLFVAFGKVVRIYEVATGQVRGEFDTEGGAFSLSVSPDGQFLATAGMNGVNVWHAATGRRLRSFPGRRGQIDSLVFSRDGARLAAAGLQNLAIVWDTSGLCDESLREKPRLEAADLEDLWNGLTDGDAVRAYRAVGTLALYPLEATPYLKERLKAGPTPEEKRVAGLIADLDNDDFDRREKASADLAKLGRTAKKELLRALADSKSPEVRQRLKLLLDNIGGPTGPPPPSAEVVRLRIVEALEGGGTTEARLVLENLARGPADAASTRAAKEALNRLMKRAAP